MPPSAEPTVTIVLASRDGERFLGQALAGLAAQSRPADEYVLVDDGSRDGTGALLAAFAASQPRARVLRRDGVGPAAACDAAVREAGGTFIAIHDDDDVSRPDRLERELAFLVAHPDVALVGSAAERTDAEGRVTGTESQPPDDAAIRARLRRAPAFVHGSVMMRREAYLAAGGYRASFAVSEDYDLYLRLSERGRLANLPEPLYRWRAHPDNTFARRRGEHLLYAAIARAFAWERAQGRPDSGRALARAASAEAFAAAGPLAPRIARYRGEALVRDGRVAGARRVLARAFAPGGEAPAALAWWAASWAVALTPRAARVRAAGRAPR